MEMMLEHGCKFKDFNKVLSQSEMDRTVVVDLSREEYGFLLRTVHLLWDTLNSDDADKMLTVIKEYNPFFSKV